MYQGTAQMPKKQQTYAPRRLLMYFGNQRLKSFEKDCMYSK